MDRFSVSLRKSEKSRVLMMMVMIWIILVISMAVTMMTVIYPFEQEVGDANWAKIANFGSSRHP